MRLVTSALPLVLALGILPAPATLPARAPTLLAGDAEQASHVSAESRRIPQRFDRAHEIAAALRRLGRAVVWAPAASAQVGPPAEKVVVTGDPTGTSATPGHAMRAEPVQINGTAICPTGALLGKALERLESGRATIKVLLMVR